MENKPQTPSADGENLQTPEGTGGKENSITPPTGKVLTPEEEEELRQFQEIKTTTGFTKFSESAKEAIRLKSENTKLKDALTEKELSEINPDYELMDEEEKKKFRLQIQNQKDILELKAKDKWREDFRKLPPDIKALIEKKGGEDAFKDYACDSSRAGADLLTVAHSFVFDLAKSAVPSNEERPGLETAGAGGQGQSSVPEEGYTAEEAANLRRNNPQKYAQLIREKKLKIK